MFFDCWRARHVSRRDGIRLVKVARGSSLAVAARADTQLEIPDALEIRYDSEIGSGRPRMTQLKKAVPGRDASQNYEYQFKNIQSTIEFDVVALHGGLFGKNDRVEGLVIEAVESPDLSDIKLACSFPAYLERTMLEFKNKVRLNSPAKGSLLGAYEDPEITAMARYLADF